MTALIARTRLTAFRLPLKQPWRFAGGQIDARSGWLLQLEDGEGNCGWGEATPFPQIGTEKPQRCLNWLRRTLAMLPGRQPQQALEALPPPGTSPPAARCGLECALLDLQARRRGLPLGRLLHPGAGSKVAVYGALGSLEQVTEEKLQEAARAGLRGVKLKVGNGTPARELARLRELAARLPTGLRLRLDANRAWDEDSARDLLGQLDPARIELVEEPLSAGTPESWKRLQLESPVPLALDESLDHGSLKPALDASAVRWLVLKPMRLGGLLPCLDIAEQAGRSGMQCLLTTSLDGALATAAAAHLAAALDAAGAPRMHGLATSALLARDLAPPPRLDRGHLVLPPGAGLGLQPDQPIGDRS